MPRFRAPYISGDGRPHVKLFNRAHHLDARGSEINTVGGNQTITINNYYGSSFDPGQVTQADQRLPGNSVCEQPSSPQIQLTGQQTLADPTPPNDPVQDPGKPRGSCKSGVFRFFKMLIAFFSCGTILPSFCHHRQLGEGGASDGLQHDIPLSDMASPSYGSNAITPTTTDSYHRSQQPGGMRMPEPIRFPSPEVHRQDGGPTSPSNPSPWAPGSHVTTGLAPLERAHTLQFPMPTLEHSTVASWGSATQTPAHYHGHSLASPSTTSPWILESDVTGPGTQALQRSATDSFGQPAHPSTFSSR
ncbi:hypothetical protein K435DRAFT_858287 [Dendrothele bispora CBS 962.96]|uniref:Uncharacterized protein n=1 Tax=Dendrothele bispora (strain CBS 962.96) TaxID=1314807 RepID=A0A4V4HFZ0_DENBC|nr:hypothetical protein K435DRAFT_858287 [Dendrothele bispora CBS 962.96]